MRIVVLLAVMACSAVFAAFAQDAATPDLSGTWLLNSSKSETHAGQADSMTWTITEKNDSITMKQVEKDGAKDRTESVNCTVNGKDCKASEGGKMSFWYNGAKLVALKTGHSGNSVTKYRMGLSPDGKTMTVEVMPLVPPSDKGEKLIFEKQ